MKNPIPQAFDDLSSFAEKSAAGLHSLQTALGIMHNTETVLRSELASGRTADNQFQVTKSVRLAATDAQDTADANAVKFITAARDVLKVHLGGRYSQAWDEAGFTSQSLAVPGTLAKRMELLKSLELYLTAHPSYEVAALNVTHAQAATLHAALSDTVSAVNQAKGEQRRKREARDAAAETLRNRLRGLVGELEQLIGPDAPRWLDFGLRVPDDESLPDMPADLVLRGGAAGHLVADWSEAGRADRYRVYKQVVGVDADFVLATTVTDADADMNTFTPGAHVRVKVTALNERGESQPSAVVEHQVP